MAVRREEGCFCLNDKTIEDFSNTILREKRICRTTLHSVLCRARAFEFAFEKPFYEFEIPEILEMYRDVNSISVRSLQNMNLFMKKASDFFSPHGKNSFDLITKDHLLLCLNDGKTDSHILSSQDIRNITDCLSNFTDKAIVLLLFLGAGGRKLREITFCDASCINQQKRIVTFNTGKRLYLSEDELEIIKTALDEDELYSFDPSVPSTPMLSLGIYKMRYNTKSENSNPENEGDAERRYRFLQRRLMLIADFLEIALTPCALQTSGLLWNLKESVVREGMPFRKFVRTDTARALAARYDIRSRFVPQILVDKFSKYFPE